MYDGLRWLGEWPCHDCGCSWPCGVGMQSRHLLLVHAILCAWSFWCDCFDPCQLSDIGFPVYVTSINVFDAMVSFGLPSYEHADAHHIHRYETLLVSHSAPNTTSPDFHHENGAPLLLYSHSKSLVRIVFCVLWCTKDEILPNYHYKNKAKCC